jgi:uncharacterized membrane protein
VKVLKGENQMNIIKNRKQQTRRLVQLSLLSAIIIVLQALALGTGVWLQTSINLTLIPIALGAMILGPSAGAFLGAVCGIVVLLCGVFNLDKFTAILFQNNPIITAGICLVKTTVAGWVAGWLYRLLKNKMPLISVFIVSALIPIINTGLFILGAFLISETIQAQFGTGDYGNVLLFIVLGLAIPGFILEFPLNVVMSPALKHIQQIVSKMR